MTILDYIDYVWFMWGVERYRSVRGWQTRRSLSDYHAIHTCVLGLDV